MGLIPYVERLPIPRWEDLQASQRQKALDPLHVDIGKAFAVNSK